LINANCYFAAKVAANYKSAILRGGVLLPPQMAVKKAAEINP